jgi:hypothetical protein
MLQRGRIRVGSSPLNVSAAILASSGRFVGALSLGAVDWPGTVHRAFDHLEPLDEDLVIARLSSARFFHPG